MKSSESNCNRISWIKWLHSTRMLRKNRGFLRRLLQPFTTVRCLFFCYDIVVFFYFKLAFSHLKMCKNFTYFTILCYFVFPSWKIAILFDWTHKCNVMYHHSWCAPHTLLHNRIQFECNSDWVDKGISNISIYHAI